MCLGHLMETMALFCCIQQTSFYNILQELTSI